jgi:hypothetical protein
MVGDILEFTRSRSRMPRSSRINYLDFIKEILPDLQAETETKSVNIELQNEPPDVKMFLDSRAAAARFFQPCPQRGRHDAGRGQDFHPLSLRPE